MEAALSYHLASKLDSTNVPAMLIREIMEDAYLDVSNYGIMATIVKNGKWGK